MPAACRNGGQVSGVLSFAVDVTREVTARKRLEAAASELRLAVDARDEFLSVASHELKTPLTALRLQVHALQRSVMRAPDQQFSAEQLRARFDAADRQVQRLVELIDSLLDVSRLQRGTIDLDLGRARSGGAGGRGRRPHAHDRRRRADRRCARGAGVAARASRRLARRSDPDQPAVERGQVRPRQPDHRAADGRARAPATHARISVTDEGIGIAPADHGRIFERFERAVSRTHYAGLGLGLWISRQIATSLGGTLTVDSDVGKGATFTLTLPL